MVKATRKPNGTNPILSLNQPVPIEAHESESQTPVSITVGRRTLRVSSLEDMWEVTDEWWRLNPIERRYYRALLENGTIVTIFHDLLSGLWFKQKG